MDRRVCTVVVLGCLCSAHCALDSSASLDDPHDHDTEMPDGGNAFPKVEIDGASTADVTSSTVADDSAKGSTNVREATADNAALLDERSGISVTMGNVKPRTDVNGAIVDAHDGCLKQ